MSNAKEINELIQSEKGLNNISVKDISDGHHTFGELYKQKMILFSVICSDYPDLSWKSRRHFDEENDPMFNGCFIVGINTPKGVATYHFKLEYWDMFDVLEIDNAPKYDFYSPDDVMERIISLKMIGDIPKQKIKRD